MSAKTEPLPCPKCGKHPRIASLFKNEDFLLWCDNARFADDTACTWLIKGTGKTRAGAIRSWNRKVRKAMNAKADD